MAASFALLALVSGHFSKVSMRAPVANQSVFDGKASRMRNRDQKNKPASRTGADTGNGIPHNLSCAIGA
jgi:hypothetical protein